MDGWTVCVMFNIFLYVCKLVIKFFITVIIASLYIWGHICPQPYSTEYLKFIGP